MTTYKGVAPIEFIKDWRNEGDIIEFCDHIILHGERYEKERVFEAKIVRQKYIGRVKRLHQEN